MQLIGGYASSMPLLLRMVEKIEIMKFRSVEELAKKVPPQEGVKVFGESSGPYLAMCEVFEVYGNLWLVDTKLTKHYRKSNALKKNDENDAKAILMLAKESLNGKLVGGVWQFKPDPLRRLLREYSKLKRLKQAACGTPLESQVKELIEAKKKETESLAKNDSLYISLHEALHLKGFSFSLAVIVSELKFSEKGVKRRSWCTLATWRQGQSSSIVRRIKNA